MNSLKIRNLTICAGLGAVLCGSTGCATRIGAPSPDDEAVRVRVETALHSDPYFYDEHVTVGMDDGNVVLQGFVASSWDLQDAIRIAARAAGDRRVIDDLEILLGGKK